MDFSLTEVQAHSRCNEGSLPREVWDFRAHKADPNILYIWETGQGNDFEWAMVTG